MPCIAYSDERIASKTMDLINKANEIIAEYQRDGYTLTLRQLYYQFVTKLYLPNTMKSYKKLGNAINRGRMNGLIDWDAILDRTRTCRTPNRWTAPDQIMSASAQQYRIDKWEGQEFRPEVWVEKDALSGVFQSLCMEMDVSFLACRGYTSQSEMWSSAMRLVEFAEQHDQKPIILHFGDHDPSGIDMSRDIQDRLGIFGARIGFERLALNMDQVRRYNPPPNPAKVTDSRFKEYEKKFGKQSWELDALNPRVLRDLVSKSILSYRDHDLWEKRLKREQTERAELLTMSDAWEDLAAYTRKNYGTEYRRNLGRISKPVRE